MTASMLPDEVLCREANPIGGGRCDSLGRGRLRGVEPPDQSPATDPGGERELVARVQRGDTAAFDGLVAGYVRRARAIAFRLMQNREDPDDPMPRADLPRARGLDDHPGLGRPQDAGSVAVKPGGRPAKPVSAASRYTRSRRCQWGT